MSDARPHTQPGLNVLRGRGIIKRAHRDVFDNVSYASGLCWWRWMSLLICEIRDPRREIYQVFECSDASQQTHLLNVMIYCKIPCAAAPPIWRGPDA